MVAARRRVSGETDMRTLEAQWQLADVLVDQRSKDEAREIRDAVLPLARRVLGPSHGVTRYLAHPDFLDPESEVRYHI